MHDHCIHHSMFVSFDTQNPDIIPNNTYNHYPPPPPPPPHLVDQPYLIYNMKNEFIGFYWYYGETINLNFVYNPMFPLVLPLGQTVPFYKFIEGKTIKVTIYNFRMEEIASNLIPPEAELKSISIRIDPELSQKMVRGLYYMQAEIYTEKDDSEKEDDSQSDTTDADIYINPEEDLEWEEVTGAEDIFAEYNSANNKPQRPKNNSYEPDFYNDTYKEPVKMVLISPRDLFLQVL